MKQDTVNKLKQNVRKNTNVHYPSWISELIIDVLDNYGKHLSEFAGPLYYVWRESVQFPIEPKKDKRHFKQSELNKIVKRHENFYLGEYQRFDGSCSNMLTFYFKRPDDKC